MAPPTTDLGGKTTPDVQVVFPSTVAAQPQKTTSNKKYKYYTGAVIFSVVILTGAILGSVALYQHLNPLQKEFDIKPTYKDVQVPEHVTINYDRKLIVINSTQYDDIVASNILHDFNKKILAYKDETNKMCYLDTTTENFDDYISQLANIDSKTETTVVHRKQSNFSVEPQVLRKFVGDDVADHCKGYPTYWLVEDDVDCESGEICRIKRRLKISGYVKISFGNGKIKVSVGIKISWRKK